VPRRHRRAALHHLSNERPTSGQEYCDEGQKNSTKPKRWLVIRDKLSEVWRFVDQVSKINGDPKSTLVCCRQIKRLLAEIIGSLYALVP
jgi:hypothetical protein